MSLAGQNAAGAWAQSLVQRTPKYKHALSLRFPKKSFRKIFSVSQQHPAAAQINKSFLVLFLL